MTDGTVCGKYLSSSGGSTYGIYYSGSKTVNISGGEIISDRTDSYTDYGIYNYNTGTINITGGTIQVNSGRVGGYGVYNKGKGIITIGTKGDGKVDTENPYIENLKGDNTNPKLVADGVYNKTGKFNFYDGKIVATDEPYTYTLTEVETGEHEYEYVEDGANVMILSSSEDDKTNVAKVDDIEYTSLKDAIAAATEGNDGTGKTVELLRRVNLKTADDTLIIESGKTVIIDLKGYPIISSMEKAVFDNKGTLTIQGGRITSSYSTVIHNQANATLNIFGTLVESTATGSSQENEGTILNEGIFNFGGDNYSGTITSAKTKYALYNSSNGTATLKGEKISGNVYNNGTITLESITNISRDFYNNKTLTMNGGSISNNLYNNQNENSQPDDSQDTKATINITGGTCTVKNIYNYNNGDVTISNGKISGIINNGTGTITMTGGEVTWDGISNNSTGTIILGTKNSTQEDFVSKTSPSVKNVREAGEPSAYGVYNNKGGTVKFYDGIITGDPLPISGEISEIEEKYEPKFIDDNKSVILGKMSGPIASVNSKTYYNLQEAINQAQNEVEPTITILKDSSIINTVKIPKEISNNITLNLKGHNLKFYKTLENNGKLEIKDDNATSGSLSSITNYVVTNNGELTLSGGEIKSSRYGIYNSKTLTMTGGKISDNTYGVYNTDESTFTLSGGDISNNRYGVYNASEKAKSTISSGNISGLSSENAKEHGYGIYNANGTSNITGVNISLTDYGVYSANGNVTMSNVIFADNINTAVRTGGGTLTINEGTIKGTEYGLYLSGGTANIKKGTFEGKTGIYTSGTLHLGTDENGDNIPDTESGITITGSEKDGIYVARGTTDIKNLTITGIENGININNGTVNITGGKTEGNNGIHVALGTVTLNSGEITGIENGIYMDNGTANIINGTVKGTTTGIHVASGTVNIGTKGNSVGSEKPVIEGNEYGIYNSRSNIKDVYFYDGIIKSKYKSIYGKGLVPEDNYKIRTSHDGDYYNSILMPEGETKTVAECGSLQYSDLQSAIDSCIEGVDGQIKLLNSITLSEPITIENGQNVTIDLNGFNIISTSTEFAIKNDGNLTIIVGDNKDDSNKITNDVGNGIENTGTLTIGQDDGITSTEYPSIEGKTYGIDNKGTFNFYDGVITGTTASVSGDISSHASGGWAISKKIVNGKEKMTLTK